MKRILLLCGFCCFFYAAVNAQANWPKTLLWRISGNGLTRDSYLYGTMHLQDKRVFNFGDSLYNYLDKAEGFAMELDMQELADSLIQYMIDQRQSADYAPKKMSTPAREKKYIDSLIRNVKLANDKASKKILNDIRREKMRHAMKNKEMPTIMDCFLYGIARRKGKWTGGIEDFHDQAVILDELSAEVSSEQFTAPDETMVSQLESMISAYRDADLNKLEQLIIGDVMWQREDDVMIRRNTKMAQRMDSMAAIRSMFFAVGAGHLPGARGVINQLRIKGYRVDPVFSTNTIDPFTYVAMLADQHWVTIEDDVKSYQVDMPGKASDFMLFDSLVKMKCYVDFSTLTFYMAGSTKSPKSVDLHYVMDHLDEKMNGTVLNKKIIDLPDRKGIELEMTMNDFYYKAQYLFKDDRLYMLLTGAEEQSNALSEATKRFFQSFVAHGITTPRRPVNWTTFELKNKAFSVKFPGVPKFKKLKAENNSWRFIQYECADNASGVYCMMQIRDVERGLHVTTDTSILSDLRTSMKETITEVTTDTVYRIDSFTAFDYNGYAQNHSIYFRIHVINRGNRSYLLYTGGAVDPDAQAIMETFIQSFTINPYQRGAWERRMPPVGDWYTTAPAPFEFYDARAEEEQKESLTDSTSLHFVSYDTLTAISYEVYRQEQSPYYWAESDSSYFSSLGLQYKGEEDAITGKTPITNGKLKGMEWTIRSASTSNVKKLRQFLNGDTLYTLIANIPVDVINSEEYKQFFTSFRVQHENPATSIFTNKAKLLLHDLSSADSTTFSTASEAMTKAVFTPKDLPLLHEAFLAMYADDTITSYSSSKDKIITQLNSLADSSTVALIEKHYGEQTGEREFVKIDMLNILARQTNQRSYALFKKLALTSPPWQRGPRKFNYHLQDSLLLSKSLYPQIIELASNPVFADEIVRLTTVMLDSNILTMQTIAPYKNLLLQVADSLLTEMKNQDPDNLYAYSYSGIINLLYHFKDNRANQLIQQFLLADDIYVKRTAAIALLRNKQPVKPAQLEKIAASDAYRRWLYRDLKEYGLLRFFPARYQTQQWLATADMYEYASDDEDPQEVKFLTTRIMSYKGQQKRFYLFRVSYGTAEDSTVTRYLGVSGPYDLDQKKLESATEAIGLYEEDFDPKKISRQFAAYMHKLEEE